MLSARFSLNTVLTHVHCKCPELHVLQPFYDLGSTVVRDGVPRTSNKAGLAQGLSRVVLRRFLYE
jgi:hypothetical protein